ncbi:MAG: SPOR domain-containing protein [Nitrospirota bacterium]
METKGREFKITKKIMGLFLAMIWTLSLTTSVQAQEKTDEKSRSPEPRTGIFIIQAGAFRDLSHAKALTKKLNDKGYNAYIILTGIKDGERLYKVCIGKFSDRKKAEALSEEIRNIEGLKTFVTLEPLEGVFVVQAGAFSDISHAKALSKRLYDKGYNAYIILSEPKEGQRLFKVCIGEFNDTKKAEVLSEEVKNVLSLQTFVTLR